MKLNRTLLIKNKQYPKKLNIMIAQRGVLNRDVTTEECPWLSKDLPKGKVVYKYFKYTYTCIGKDGVAVSDKNDEEPFYEVPRTSVNWDS